MSDSVYGSQLQTSGSRYPQPDRVAGATQPRQQTHAEELDRAVGLLRDEIHSARTRIGSLAERLGVPPASSATSGTTGVEKSPPGILTSVGFTVRSAQNIVSDIHSLLNEIEQRI